MPRYLRPSILLTLVLVLIFSLLASGCQRFLAPEPTPTPLLSSFNPARGMSTIDCPFSGPQEIEASCGTLEVPLDYAQLEGDKIKLVVVIIHSTSETPASDAVVLLPQNAGMTLMDSVGYIGRQLSDLLATRDMVYYEYRGLGQEDIDLSCPEYYDAYFESWLQPRSPDEVVSLYTPALKTCKERMANNDININDFRMQEMASDLNMLRLALGYEQFDLLGGGFGSELTLTMLRDYPQAIRSVFLFDLAFPKQYLTAEMYAIGMQESLDILFNRCLEDEKCRLAYPSLEQQFYAAVDQLNARPAEIKVFYPKQTGLTSIFFTGDDFLMLIHDLLRSNSTISEIPKIVNEISSGKPERMATVIQQYRMSLPEEVVLGPEISATCEGLHPAFWRVTAASSSVQPAILEAVQADWRTFEQLCPLWTGNALDSPAEQVINSDVPALIIQGEYTPDYTPETVNSLLRGMKNSLHVVIPNLSNDIFSGESCAGLLLFNWLNETNTGMDTSCVNNTEPIEFRLPNQ